MIMTLTTTKETSCVARKLGRDKRLMQVLAAQPTIHDLEVIVRSWILQGVLPRIDGDKVQYDSLFEHLKQWRD